MKKETFGIVGCGWLGLPLAESLLQENITVHGTSRDQLNVDTLSSKGIKGHVLKEKDFFKPQEWLRKLDVLVLNIPPSDFEDYPKAMASICEQLNKECRVIFVSSTSVYPDVNDWVDEATPATGEKRNGPKVASTEQLLNSLMHDRLTIVRMAGLVGGDRNPIRFVSGKKMSGGENPVNLVHRDDCIEIIKRVAGKGFKGKTLNVCSSEHPSRKEYYEYIANKLNIPAPQFTEDKAPFKKVDNTRSKKELGYKYKFDTPFDFPL